MSLEEAEAHQLVERGTSVSPLHSLWAGATAFIAGGAIAGASHFAGTAKALEEEGISKAQRLRALPTAAKALAVSTAACVAFGAIGFYAITLAGLPVKDTAEVSSLHNAISLAEEQRNLTAAALQAFIKKEFQKQLGVWPGDNGQIET